ncbi:MAG: hypothetical protein WBD90_13625 [Xanthobacteraceae bacterium]
MLERFVAGPKHCDVNLLVQDKAKYALNIGKNFWITGAVSLCPQPVTEERGCTLVGPGPHVRFTVDRIEEAREEVGGRIYPGGLAYCHAALEDGRAGHVLCAELFAGATATDPAITAAECKRRGDPRIGMSAQQVLATCWGKPGKVNRVETARAIKEVYAYTGNRYVYLRNGVVRKIRTSGILH